MVAAIAVKSGLATDFVSCKLKTLDEIMLAKSLDFEQMLDLTKEVFKKNKDFKIEDI